MIGLVICIILDQGGRVIKLEAATLSLEKPVPAPVSPLNTSPPKTLDRLSGLGYAS
ncbi:protein of unknown function [Candidatus Methylomirabilis oxygeniifera]|uniref:Uncharacterized protein n=1 Tax=Methylomirabilis oxygeniifera TaxID=671143 RepID=D5MG50_METO1|nr:protein of unknown function [Candidatus Methylomirabilis oxyfera]